MYSGDLQQKVKVNTTDSTIGSDKDGEVAALSATLLIGGGSEQERNPAPSLIKHGSSHPRSIPLGSVGSCLGSFYKLLRRLPFLQWVYIFLLWVPEWLKSSIWLIAVQDEGLGSGLHLLLLWIIRQMLLSKAMHKSKCTIQGYIWQLGIWKYCMKVSYDR